MKRKVPLWGLVLAGSIMLFVVASHQLGFAEAMHFCLFVTDAFLWGLSVFAAYAAFIVAVAFGLVTFLQGLERGPDTKQCHFVNCFVVSSVSAGIGACFVWLSCFVQDNSTILSAVVDNPFVEFPFWEMYATALVVSIGLRAVKKNWFADW